MGILDKISSAFAKDYEKDPDPRHWRTIEHSHVHIDAGGKIDGGAGGKFTGKTWTSVKHPHDPSHYPKKEPSAPPEPPKKTVEDLRKAWKAVTKERMEIHRAKTEKGRKKHEDLLDKAYKEYTDMRAAMDPAEAAKFKPSSAGTATSKKAAPKAATPPEPATPLEGLAEISTESKEVLGKVQDFFEAAEGALYAFGMFKKGEPAGLAEAKDALVDVEEAIKDIPKDSEAFKQARRQLVEMCKTLGLTEYAKLKDVFKAIKNASTAPTPSEAMETLSDAGKEAKIEKTRKSTVTLKKYDEQRKKCEDLTYKAYGFTDAERTEFEQRMKEIFAASSYGMTMKTKVLDLVLDSKFKSQYETGTSGGASGTSAIEGRARIFGKILGTGKTTPSAFPKEVREKYGALVSSDMSAVDDTASWYGEEYGSKYGRAGVLIRFKKDRLAGKVTYTWGDSLDYYRYEDLDDEAAGDADHPSIAGFSSGCCKHASKSEILSAARKAKDIGDFRKKLKMTRGSDSYMELQYHGDLGIEDIETVQFKDEPPSAELVKKCKAKGIRCVDSHGKEL